MLTSLKLLGKSTRTGVVFLSSQQPAAVDPFAALVNDLQNDTTPLRPTPFTASNAKDFLPSDKLSKWAEKHKNLEDGEQMLFLLRNTSLLARSGELQSDQPQKLISDCKLKNKRIPDAEKLESMSILIDLGLHETELFNTLSEATFGGKMEDKLVAGPATILSFIVAANKKELLGKDVVAKLEKTLQKQASSLKTTEILTLFANLPTMSPSFTKTLLEQTEALLPVMSSLEVAALMRNLSIRGLRNQALLAKLAQSVSESKTSLTISQIVTVAHSCAFLKFYDARLLRRISKDLAVEINHLNSYNDATNLVESFKRIRLGDKEVWKCLSNWFNARLPEVEKKPIKSVAVVVNAFASMGVENAKPVAGVLLSKLQRPKARDTVPNQDTWLQAVYSLALCDIITPQLAETVLNNEFIQHMLKNSRNAQERISSARKLLQLQAVVVKKYGAEYKGPRITRETFGTLLTSEEGVSTALQGKFGRFVKDSTDALLTTGLHKLAPRTHIAAPGIDEMGFIHEAIVSLDENGRFVPLAAWNEQTKKRSVVLIGWKQRKKSLDLDLGRPSDESLLGEEKLMLRLLPQRPVLVFQSDLAFITQEEKNKFLKSLFDSK